MQIIKFGTDGWRGVIAREFTFENVSIVAQATMDYMTREGLAAKGLVIGYDRRFLSREFAERTAEIAAGNGIRVLLTAATRRLRRSPGRFIPVRPAAG